MSAIASHPETRCVHGFETVIDSALGQLSVNHDGTITWDQLQAIKNAVWGEEANAIEVYPAQSRLVNSRNCRHLWRLGKSDFCPDLLGVIDTEDNLSVRFGRNWDEAWDQFGGAHE